MGADVVALENVDVEKETDRWNNVSMSKRGVVGKGFWFGSVETWREGSTNAKRKGSKEGRPEEEGRTCLLSTSSRREEGRMEGGGRRREKEGGGGRRWWWCLLKEGGGEVRDVGRAGGGDEEGKKGQWDKGTKKKKRKEEKRRKEILTRARKDERMETTGRTAPGDGWLLVDDDRVWFVCVCVCVCLSALLCYSYAVRTEDRRGGKLNPRIALSL